MPVAKRKVAARLKRKVKTPKRSIARAVKRAAKKGPQLLRKVIETGKKNIAPESLELFEVVETRVFDEPLMVELDEEEI